MRVALFFVLFLPTVASGQFAWRPARLDPPAPAATQIIRATFGLPGDCGSKVATTVVEGTVVRTTVVQTDCLFIDPPFHGPAIVDFGPLAPGTYTYEIFYTTEGGPLEFRSTQPLIVQIAPIPTLSQLSLMILAVALAAAALVARVR